MGIADQATRHSFSYTQGVIYQALLVVLPRCGFSIRSHDPVLFRIAASAGLSAFSWGENLSFAVEKVDEGNCILHMESSLKVGINLLGVHRNQQNFQTLFQWLSTYLQWMDYLNASYFPLPEEKRVKFWQGLDEAQRGLIQSFFNITPPQS